MEIKRKKNSQWHKQPRTWRELEGSRNVKIKDGEKSCTSHCHMTQYLYWLNGTKRYSYLHSCWEFEIQYHSRLNTITIKSLVTHRYETCLNQLKPSPATNQGNKLPDIWLWTNAPIAVNCYVAINIFYNRQQHLKSSLLWKLTQQHSDDYVACTVHLQFTSAQIIWLAWEIFIRHIEFWIRNSRSKHSY